MPLSDFLETLGDLGSSGRGWRSWPAIAGAATGAGVGAYFGYQSNGVLEALAGAGGGALVGWLVGVTLRGFAVFLAILVLVVVVMLGWDWLAGVFG